VLPASQQPQALVLSPSAARPIPGSPGLQAAAAGGASAPSGPALVGSPSISNHAAAELLRSASGAQQLLAGAAAAGTNPAAAAAAGQQGLSPSALQHQQAKVPVATMADRLADTGKVGGASCLAGALGCWVAVCCKSPLL